MWRLSEGRVTLELDKYECGVIFHSLKDKRNQMLKELKEERSTDAVDDVLLKVIEKMEVPPEKPRRGHRRHEER